MTDSGYSNFIQKQSGILRKEKPEKSNHYNQNHRSKPKTADFKSEANEDEFKVTKVKQDSDNYKNKNSFKSRGSH